MPMAECGSETAYRYHYDRGEKPCDLCRSARAERRRADYIARHGFYRDQARRNYDRNRDKILAVTKEYHRKNPDVMQRTKNRRRAAQYATRSERYTERMAIDAHGTMCHICGEEIDMAAKRHPGDPGWERGLHLDHVIPLRSGGTDTLDNIRPAHGLCNLRKGTDRVRK